MEGNDDVEANIVDKDVNVFRWIILTLLLIVCWLIYRRVLRKSVRGMCKSIVARFMDKFQTKYNERMYSRKKALLFDGLSQMATVAGRPLHVLEIGSGAGANFAFYPEGTTVSCLDPVPQFRDILMKNAGRFPQVQLGELYVGFAEDLAVVESGTVDAVVCTLVLCSVRNIDKCLLEIMRVLKPVSIDGWQ